MKDMDWSPTSWQPLILDRSAKSKYFKSGNFHVINLVRVIFTVNNFGTIEMPMIQYNVQYKYVVDYS